MLSPRMARSPRRLLLAPLLVAALGLGACGEQGIELAEGDPHYEGAVIFDQNCAGCHTLDAAGARGSSTDIGSREYKDGPNFNERVESVDDVLYAIENGGFSSGPMPQNIVTGEEARKVAEFVAEYSRGERLTASQQGAPTGSD
jgi:mono/diheme cytochrome c family protein